MTPDLPKLLAPLNSLLQPLIQAGLGNPLLFTPGVTVLDVRPTDEYMAGHIPGALSVPLDRLKEILANLPTDQEIVAYCRGPYCVLSVQAVEVLRANGFNAIRLEESVQDWRAMGLTVEIGD
mgnify:CR=1 FL=1